MPRLQETKNDLLRLSVEVEVEVEALNKV